MSNDNKSDNTDSVNNENPDSKALEAELAKGTPKRTAQAIVLKKSNKDK